MKTTKQTLVRLACACALLVSVASVVRADYDVYQWWPNINSYIYTGTAISSTYGGDILYGGPGGTIDRRYLYNEP